MEFGKVSDITQVLFAEPEPDPRTDRALDARGSARSFRAFLGAPAWGSKAWLGSLYPKGARPSDFLRHYAARFNSIELNSTHYRVPGSETVRHWRESTPDGFRFCPKIPQGISHHRFLRGTERETEAFVAAMSALGTRLGCAFLQLPPAFAPVDLPLLGAWLARLPSGFEVAVEFRHPGFFPGGLLAPAAYELLSASGAAVVITDVAGRRDVFHGSLTGKTVFLRFVLNRLHPTDFVRASAWTARLAGWKAKGLGTAYVFAHQPDDAATPEFVARWAPELNRALGLDLRSPLEPVEAERAAPAEQLGFFDFLS